MAMKWAIAIMSDRPNLLQRQSLGHLGHDARGAALLDFRLVLAEDDRRRAVLGDAEHLSPRDRNLRKCEIAAFRRFLAREVELDLVARREAVPARDVDHDVALNGAKHRLAGDPAHHTTHAVGTVSYTHLRAHETPE